MSPPEGSAPPAADTDRLNGWKEIASFVGKGVRTAQRWERDFGMPVRRLGSNGGEVVFASRAEIAAWMQTAAHRRAAAVPAPEDVAEPGPDLAPEAAVTSDRERSNRSDVSGRRGWGAGKRFVAALLVAAAAAGLWWWRNPGHAGPGGRGQPADWRVQDDRLTVLDSQGDTLWSHVVQADLAEETYGPYAVPDRGLPASVRIEDIDGDGSREVLFAVKTLRVARPSLRVFNADGSVRFSNAPPAVTLRFGGTDYPPEWMVMGTWTTTNSSGERSIWVLYYQRPHFPSLLTRLDAGGAMRSEYVSNGYIRSVGEARWKGRDTVLVAAINNESRGGSLAIFNDGEVRGSAPAEDPKYRCENCPSGGPSHFLVFPRTCMSTWPGNLVPVSQAWTDTDDRVWAVTQHDRFESRREDQPAGGILYGFDRNLAPVSVELDGPFVRRHLELEATGVLDHVLDPADAAKALPVRIWKDSRFVGLPRVPVEIAR
jgi:hypothetical protein